MRRVFKTRTFDRWAKRARLKDPALCEAVAEMVAGQIDARLGGSIFKKRVALPGRGKSGRTRTLLATNMGTRWYFVFGFEKNERDNITDLELSALKRLATDLLKLTDAQIPAALDAETLKEICNDHNQA